MSELSAAARPPIFLPVAVFALGGEELVVNGVSLHIYSAGDGAVLDAQGLSRLFHLRNGANLTLDGLRLRNGAAPIGGAIQVSSGSTATLSRLGVTDCTANDATAAYGGALYVMEGSAVVAMHVTFTRCTAVGAKPYGGAIAIAGSAVREWDGTAWAVASLARSAVALSNCHFMSCSADSSSSSAYGGVVY
eukprot:968608-Prymnesium_polylepis.1